MVPGCRPGDSGVHSCLDWCKRLPGKGIRGAVFGFSSARPCGGKASVRSIHSSCGKPCGKTGNEDRNSLISNEKDQAAHKWVYCVKSLKISMLIIPTKFRVPMGEDFAGNPAITGFSTIGLRECPTGRGFWRSEPCRSNSCKAFARKGVNKGCPSCYRLSCRRAPSRGP